MLVSKHYNSRHPEMRANPTMLLETIPALQITLCSRASHPIAN